MIQSAACRTDPLANDCEPTDEQLEMIMAAAARSAREIRARVDAELYRQIAVELEAAKARARARGSIFVQDHD